MYSGYMLWKRLANRESLLTRFGVSLRFATFMRNYVNVSNFYFNSIGDIIDHYRKEQIVEGYYLKEPVPMQVSVVFL